jgi:hypothetical protein
MGLCIHDVPAYSEITHGAEAGRKKFRQTDDAFLMRGLKRRKG